MNYISTEIFDDLNQAQIKVLYWQQKGAQNVRLLTVNTATVYDYRKTPALVYDSLPGSVLHVVQHEG